MEERIENYCQKYKVDGLSICMMKEGQLVYEKHIRSNRSMRYTIGSVSKIFVAIGILELVERGKCHLEDEVCQYIKGFYPGITLEMLLNHSSGLTSTSFKWKYTNPYYEHYIDEVLAFYQRTPLKSKPGKYSVYCNDGFVIGQKVIEVISGKSFLEFITENITGPLHMDDTTCPPAKMEEGTYCHAANAMGGLYPQEYVNGIGSGGVYSTAYDLCLLMHSFVSGNLLSLGSIRNMTSNHCMNHLDVELNGFGCGYGLDHVEMPLFKALGYKAFCKGGATYGYYSYVIMIPDLDLTIACTSASDQGNVGTLAKELLYEYLGEPQCSNTLPAIGTSDHLGIYGANNRVYKLYKKDGKLLVDVYEHRQFVHHWTMSGDHGVYYGKDAFGFRNAALYMHEYDGIHYLILDYDDIIPTVRNRCALAQECIVEQPSLALETGLYVRNNEYLYQRNFNTQGELTIDLDSTELYSPYPLKAVNDHYAIPYIELPGNYSREMCPLRVIDNHHFELGYYTYVLLKDTVLHSFTLEDNKLHWFKYNNEQYQTNARVIGINKQGDYTYDSCLADTHFIGDYIGFIGEVGDEIKIQ